MSTDRPKDESFAALFEAKGQATPRRRGWRTGETVDAVVLQVGRDAVFVELEGHGQGFIEATDLQAADGALKVAVGDRLRARVVSVDREQGVRLVPTVEAAVAAGAAVSLGGAEDPAAPKISVGQVVTGTVDRIELYGLFVQIEGTRGRAGRGLLPAAELGVPRGADLRKLFPPGTKVTAKVLEIGEGKLRLSARAIKDDEERAQFDGFREQEKKKAAPQSLGTLGDLLGRAKKK
jgi:small subunit ribosomal protein S1